ncbi:MAG: WG repeat-containing protein [Lewinellaceae bacterium]|nr:WG repeat-containing protein [Lewinellaceae bacterium]
MFDKIEALRVEAEKSKQQVLVALDQVKAEQEKTAAALGKANKLIDAFYFYDEKFALAFKDANYYFIDKNGDPVTKLGQWETAEQFDGRGYAKVKKRGDNANYLLDTLGNRYKVAYQINELGPEITALDLSDKQLTQIPEAVFQQAQLKVLLLNNNNLASLPIEIGRLSNLTCLDLFSNLTVRQSAMEICSLDLDNCGYPTGALKNLPWT